MRATVEDVHQRHRQTVGLGPAEVAVQRQTGLVGRGLRDRQGAAEDRVGAEAALVGRAVELDHRPVDHGLVGGLEADQHSGKLVLDIGDRLQDTLARERPGVAVTKLDRLEGAGAGARRDGGPAGGTTGERGLDFDGRLTARIQDLTGMNGGDLRHRLPRAWRR